MENKIDKKKTIIGIVLVIVALLLIVGIVLIVVNQAGGPASDDESAESNITQDSTGSQNGTETDAVTESKGNNDNNVLNVVYNITNQWGSGESYFKQYDFKIENNTGATQENWQVAIRFVNGTKISSSWNCECEIKNDVLYIRPGDSYGSIIKPNEKVEGIGIIIESPSDNPLLEVLDSSSDKVVQEESSQPQTGNENETQTKEPVQIPPKETVAVSGETPLARHGKLSVSGTGIVDCHGNKFRLCGVSTHGLQWFPQYVNKGAFQTLRDDWGANVIRLAMYVREGGYTQGDKAQFKKLIDDGITYATQLGMYVIVDWHVLSYNPNETKDEAVAFFTEMAQKYSSYNNVIYEICNEPTGSPWASQIKPYATELVSTIRRYDSDAIIIVGTNTWSQDVDEVIGNRLENDKNVMYAVHFYAATHTDGIRDKVKRAADAGIPVFISECSICDASGSGGINYSEADKWFNLLEERNISYICWNLCNKNETSALLSPGCQKTSGFTDGDLSETGKWFKARISKDAKGK